MSLDRVGQGPHQRRGGESAAQLPVGQRFAYLGSQRPRLVSQRELKGLTHDLMITIPPLAKLNHDSIPLLGESRALSSCQNQVLLP